MPAERTYDTMTTTINYAEYMEQREEEVSGAVAYPLVLLHGGSARWQASLPIIPVLSENYHLYAPDLRGHGKSGRTPGHYTLSNYAVDVAAFLEGVVREPAVLYGHSLGGQVAIMVAALYPQLVKGLLIGDAPFDRRKLRSNLQRGRGQLLLWREMAGSHYSTEEIVVALKNMPVTVVGQAEPERAGTLFGEDSPWFPYMAENLRLLDPDMLTAVLEFDKMHEAYDCERLFPSIMCPVLVIQGNPDLGGGLSDEEIGMAKTLIPNVMVVRLETVGHALDYPDKEPLLSAMQSFLDAI